MKCEAPVLKALLRNQYETMVATLASINESAYSLKLDLPPNEHPIQAMLTNFHACFNTSIPFTIQRVAPENPLHELFLFAANPSNKNKTLNHPLGASYAEHCLTIEVQGKIVGAIYFTIDLDYRTIYINTLEINALYQKNHLGYFLLHSAMYVGLLHGCTSTCLYALPAAISFYAKQGFIDFTYQMKCDLTLPKSQILFLDSVKKTAPQFVDEMKQSIQRAQFMQQKAYQQKSKVAFSIPLWSIPNPLRIV